MSNTNGPQPFSWGYTIDVGTQPAESSAGAAGPGAASTVAASVLTQRLDRLIELGERQVTLLTEQVELARRAEERFKKQQQQQRDELRRWLDDHPFLRGRCNAVQETIGKLLGEAVTELADYVEANDDDLPVSEFLRGEMVDRFGATLNHLSAMYAMMKRLAAVEEGENDGQQKPSDVTL